MPDMKKSDLMTMQLTIKESSTRLTTPESPHIVLVMVRVLEKTLPFSIAHLPFITNFWIFLVSRAPHTTVSVFACLRQYNASLISDISNF